LRIAVVSPFVDKEHGTERAIAELVERLAYSHGHEVHLYSQRVKDVELFRECSGNERRGSIRWRRVASAPGPLILSFAAWYLLNRRARRTDSSKGGEKFDLVFSPGINCADADAILVHAVFHRLRELQAESGAGWLKKLHRNLYYRQLCRLERKIYTDRHVALAAVSERTAAQLAHYFGREDVRVIPNGVDTQTFHPVARERLRKAARERWNYTDSDFVVLLVGNDWRNKGLDRLLGAAARCGVIPIQVLVVGADSVSDWMATVVRLGITSQVKFAPPSENILEYYAAADMVAAPSREDSFNLPVLEGMACGLAVVTTTSAGVSSLIRNGVDGFVLENAEVPEELPGYLQRLSTDKGLRSSIGVRAAQTASEWTWDRAINATEKFMREAVRNKRHRTT
jgi:UDP-glucose:(heptosyl)LPS alpha-1,3-glucosyltransferase